MKTAVNKSAIVRDILSEIGAVATNPPEGWRKTVEERLAKQSLKMNQISIYQLRQKMMKDANIKSSGRGRKKGSKNTVSAAAPKTKAPKAKASTKEQTFNIADLQSVRDFSQQFGGVDKLAEVVNVLKSFQS